MSDWDTYWATADRLAAERATERATHHPRHPSMGQRFIDRMKSIFPELTR